MKRTKANQDGVMIGTFEGVELTHNQFGQQYTTIDGAKYVTFFDLAVPELRGLRSGSKLEFTTTPGPTILCHSPHVQEALPAANVRRVLDERKERSWD